MAKRFIVSILVIVFFLSACGSPATTPAPADTMAAPTAMPAGMAMDTATPAPTMAMDMPTTAPTMDMAGMGMHTKYPLTIIDCGGYTSTFTQAPKTPVTLDPQAYELMFWMGLGQLQIAAGPQPLPAVPDQFKDQTKTVKTITRAQDAAYVSKEALLAANPDFVYGSYQSGFNGDAVFTEDELKAKGINVYWSFGIGGCKDDNPQSPRTNLDGTFRDIENLGRIFDVQDKATQLITQMKADLAKALPSVGSGKKPTIALYAYDEAAKDTPGEYNATSTANAIITLAGGVNPFADLKDAYNTIDWESFIKANPDVIILVAYPAAIPQAWDDGEKYLLSVQALQNVSAIKNKRLVRLIFPEIGVGGIRNVDAVKKLADVLKTVK